MELSVLMLFYLLIYWELYNEVNFSTVIVDQYSIISDIQSLLNHSPLINLFILLYRFNAGTHFSYNGCVCRCAFKQTHFT